MQENSSTGETRFAILVSPFAGQFRRDPAKLVEILTQARALGRVWSPSTEAELRAAAVEIHEFRPSHLVLVGGDGSLMRALSQLYDTFGSDPFPILVPLAAGTVNLAVRRWGGAGDGLAAMKNLSGSFAAPSISVRSLEVNLDGHLYIAFTVGTGLISNFFEEYDRQGHRGNFSAALILVKTLVGSWVSSAYSKRIFAPTPASLSIPGQDFGKLPFTLLVSSVFVDLGLGLKPTYRAHEAKGQLHLVASTLRARALGSKVWRVLRAQPLQREPRAPSSIDVLTHSFELEFDHPTKVILDGDAVTARRVSVRPGPNLSVQLI